VPEAVACCDVCGYPESADNGAQQASPNDAVDAPVAEKAAADADTATTPSEAEPMKVLQSIWDASAVATAARGDLRFMPFFELDPSSEQHDDVDATAGTDRGGVEDLTKPLLAPAKAAATFRWRQRADDEGLPYYVDSKTGDTVRAAPEAWVAFTRERGYDLPTGVVRRVGSICEYLDEKSGRVYYHDSETSSTAWARPAAFADEEDRAAEAMSFDPSKLALVRTLKGHSHYARCGVHCTLVMMCLRRRSMALPCFRTGGASFLVMGPTTTLPSQECSRCGTWRPVDAWRR